MNLREDFCPRYMSADELKSRYAEEEYEGPVWAWSCSEHCYRGYVSPEVFQNLPPDAVGDVASRSSNLWYASEEAAYEALTEAILKTEVTL